MGGHQQGPAVGGKVREELVEQFLGGDVDAGERLIQEQEPGFARQCSGHQDPLALSAGEFADRAAAQVGEADQFQCLVDGGPVCGPGSVQPAHGAGAAGEDGSGDVDGEVPGELVALRHVSDQVPGPGRRHILDEDVAAGERVQAEDVTQQRGLARPVRAEQAQQLALV
ncbi:UNVERIFIED_CONTAM: hypothetical protein RKD50_009602 [Streptomyces canus]